MISLVLLLLVQWSMGQETIPVSNVLIVDGFSNHNWEQTTKMTRKILEETGLFSVSVSTTPSTPEDPAWQSWDPEFATYDVVIQNCNNIRNKQMRWPPSIEKDLEDYVKKGGGLYILHSANNSFPDWDQYNLMIGMGWRNRDAGAALEIGEDGSIIRIPAGEGEKTSHGPRFEALIQILNRHNINEDFPDSWRTPNLELYLYPRGPAKNLTVLSYAKDPVAGKNWPVEWLVQYGEGWVYNSSLGHLWKGETYPDSYRCIGFQTTLIRTLEWLATGQVSYPLPADFPTAQSTSLK
jgi:type 1 glutamine amidotransferase